MSFRAFLLVLLALICLPVFGWAQTSTDLNEGSQLSQDPTTNLYTFSWWGQAGRTYFIQQSDDLIHWAYLPVIESGNDDVIQWAFTSTAPAFFVRLKYTDIFTFDPFNDDFDGDGISNWNELLQGTDPLSAALDTNGLPLDWESFYNVPLGTDPNSLAPCGSGITYLQAFQNGWNPNTYIPPPSSLVVSASSPTTLHLSWINGTTDSSGVLVERSTDGGQTWTTIATLASTATTYDDTSVSANTAYTYRISTLSKNGGPGDTGGTSSPTNSSTATLPTRPTSSEVLSLYTWPVARTTDQIDMTVFVGGQTDPFTSVGIYDVTNGTRTKIMDVPWDVNQSKGCEWINAPAGKHYLMAQAIDSSGKIIVSAVQLIEVMADLLPPVYTQPKRDFILQSDAIDNGGVCYKDLPFGCMLLAEPDGPNDGQGYTRVKTTHVWSGDTLDESTGPEWYQNNCTCDTSTIGEKSVTITMVTTWKGNDGTTTTTELDDTFKYRVVDAQIQVQAPATAQPTDRSTRGVSTDLVGTLAFTVQVSGAQSGDTIVFESGITCYKLWAVKNGARTRVSPGQAFDATNLPSFEVEASSDKAPFSPIPGSINEVDISYYTSTDSLITFSPPNLIPLDSVHGIEPMIVFSHMVTIDLLPNIVPTTGVSNASVRIQKVYGFGENDYAPATTPTAIKINGKAASNIRQDAGDPSLFYFDPDVSSTMTVGAYDLEVDNLSFVNIPAGNVIVKSGVNVTSNVDIAMSSFATAMNVAIQEANLFAQNIINQGGSVQEAETAFEEQTDHQVPIYSYLIKSFLNGLTTDHVVDAELQYMQASGDNAIIQVCATDGFDGGQPASTASVSSSPYSGTTAGTPTPQIGSTSFFSDVKSYLASIGNKIFQGTFGDTSFAVVNADDFQLSTFDLGGYPAGGSVGKIVDDAVTANPQASIILNGAFFNWHANKPDAEPLTTIGVVLNNGVPQSTSNLGKPSHVKSDLAYWFGQTFDHSATTNAGHALTYLTGGKGNPPIPVGTKNSTDLNAAIGGLTSLILQDTSGKPYKVLPSNSDPVHGDTDLNTLDFIARSV